ncbi:hypothetical protein [Bacillus sp. FJAT-27264]|uniref:hypothetical protein n=1 Tax=Paenibacillus sp. (strain DSM 101736 / FJAT-27264) TaxID=1850362 RepID=UPI001C307DC3
MSDWLGGGRCSGNNSGVQTPGSFEPMKDMVGGGAFGAWRDKLAMREVITDYAERLYRERAWG